MQWRHYTAVLELAGRQPRQTCWRQLLHRWISSGLAAQGPADLLRTPPFRQQLGVTLTQLRRLLDAARMSPYTTSYGLPVRVECAVAGATADCAGIAA